MAFAKGDDFPRLVIITIDGLRWQEVFSGAEESLLSNTKEVRNVEQTRRLYWRHTPVDRRMALMPFVWNTVAKQGMLIGNRNLGSVMQVANKTNISFPGYSEMMTGIVDEKITSNDPVNNPFKDSIKVTLDMRGYFFRRQNDGTAFGRRISTETVRSAAAILAVYLGLFITASAVICGVEKLPLLTCMFESASALGTVGLSLGVTAKLGALSRCILICLMYVGRVGGLTLIFAAVPAGAQFAARFPEERVSVG